MFELAITCGDPAGIGPEIIIKWARSRPDQSTRSYLFGPRWLIEQSGMQGEIVGPLKSATCYGKPSEDTARIAMESMQAAAEACRNKLCKAVVTAPVSKFWLHQAGYRFPGQTEFFAREWRGRPVMAFVGERLRVVLVTWHDPLMTVAGLLREKPHLLTHAVEQADRLAQALGNINPRIGVCGLNPHAGEGGILGTEERDFLDPQLNQLRNRFPRLSPCLPGDTVFMRAVKGDFDVVIALYHDQGLAPVKTLEFDTAVNTTLGLPFIRTSPDHGTAFDIAGRQSANPRSFCRAVEVAIALNRRL